MNELLTATDAATVATEPWRFGAENLYSDIMIVALVIVMLTLLFAATVVHRAMKSILNVTMPEVLKKEAEAKKLAKIENKNKWKKTWNNIAGLRPLEEEKDMEIDHEYDGIKELNNPIPIWFNALFYSTVVFAVVYLLIYQVFGWGMNQDQEYVHEMEQAEIAKQAYLAQAANLIDETSVEFNAASAPAGKAIFMANCAACHGANGEGTIGPNLTDKFWIHGAEIKDVFRTVKYGVPEKGMVPWEQTLTPAQIAEVSSYILTLRDTNPANQKAAEGIEVVYESEGGSEETVESDSTATN